MNHAVVRKHTDIVQVLIDAKACLDVQNRDGYTPMHIAARDCYTEILQLLLADATAVEKGHIGAVQVPIAATASIVIQNNDTLMHILDRDEMR